MKSKHVVASDCTHLRIFSVFITLIVLLATISSSAAADETLLLSPPLDVLDGRRLALVAPPDWHFADQDPVHNWSYSSYDFSLVPPAGNASDTGKLQAEVLQHDIERARLHGALEGQPFRTASGLHGIVQHVEFKPGERDWYLTIPVRSTKSAVIVRVIFQSGSIAKQHAFVGRFYRHVRLLAP